MRRLMHITGLLALLLTPVITLHSQPKPTPPTAAVPVDPDTKMIMYRGVVDQEGTSGYLYDKAIEWFRAYYVNPTSVFSVQDRTNGKIEGTGRMKIFYNTPDGTKMEGGVVLYNIKVELKENKYRYTLTDFLLKAASRYPCEKWLNKNDPAYNPQWDSYLYQVDTTMQSLVVKLKAGMKPTVKKTDEW